MRIYELNRPIKRLTALASRGGAFVAVVLLFAALPAGRAVATPVTRAAAANGSSVLSFGSKGPTVVELQRRLITLGYRPGTPDGTFGTSTASAVLAFQKRQGISRTSTVGPQVQDALSHPTGAGPRVGLPTPRVEVDIARQIAFVVLLNRPVITLNVSTGSGLPYRSPNGVRDIADTPIGSFTVLRKIAGDQKAPLGILHSPLYFYRGWAIHGSSSVPSYPASHGCVRLSNVDDDWLFSLVPAGTRVILYDSTGKSPRVDQLPRQAAAGL